VNDKPENDTTSESKLRVMHLIITECQKQKNSLLISIIEKMIWVWTFKKRTRNSQWADSWALSRQSFEKDIFFLSHLERKFIKKVIHKENEEKRQCSRTSKLELGITHEIFHQWQCGVIKLTDSFRAVNEFSELSIKSSDLFI